MFFKGWEIAHPVEGAPHCVQTLHLNCSNTWEHHRRHTSTWGPAGRLMFAMAGNSPLGTDPHYPPIAGLFTVLILLPTTVVSICRGDSLLDTDAQGHEPLPQLQCVNRPTNPAMRIGLPAMCFPCVLYEHLPRQSSQCHRPLQHVQMYIATTITLHCDLL